MEDKNKIAMKRGDNNDFKCAHAKKCGSCKYINSTYESQCKAKEEYLTRLLKPFVTPEPFIKCVEPMFYRNKVHAVFGEGKGRTVIAGTYEEGTHRIVPIDKCLIENEKADEILGTIKELLPSFKIRPYDEDKGTGLLRHVLIRRGYRTGEILVVLVIVDPVFPSKNNFVKALLKKHPEISTIVLNINDKKTGMVLGERQKVIYGKGYITDELLGKRFSIGAGTFYQINSLQCEKLYLKAFEFLKPKKQDVVIDAYCGIGTIGICLASKVKEVYGVELNEESVKNAGKNAKANNVTNVKFYANDAGRFMTDLAVKGKTVDAVITDPPRSGLTKEFKDAIIKMAPQKLVYISCNPVTLAADLKDLKKGGYSVKRAVGFDMFPWTDGIETCALLTKASEA
ncbi:MAG: 23S rRNA (uracil(1939)-C(5))-methyltransferase RlmD [Lachnospiraceae bacterium]|nr:23S rRNA (uracil(1939)-C(5))-methyltransferase RlmD [Lachnospiraceae bacterium]